MLFITLILTACLVCTTNGAFYYPNLQTSLLEHILVDNWDAYASNFSSAITPCTRYVTETGTAALNSGRTTAAQWIRVLFHDFITANVTAETGGVDASIGFETHREENSGSAFNDSFTFWRPFVNEAVSMADLVALGTVMSNNLCGGNNLPYRSGRVDAIAAGSTTGVPAPETSLDETLMFFERAGFDAVDAIGLTACGHTLGSVHHGGFPTVVDSSAVTPNNTNGGSNFDTTRGVFDPTVVGEYLSWTGRRGGPLVTSDNETTRSDLRLYESDKNTTMRALFAQGAGFLDTCVVLMRRAMDTVPSGVQLGDIIEPMNVKPINVTYDFDSDGKLKLSGRIRILTAAGTSSPETLTLSVSGRDTNLIAENATGTSLFGRNGNVFGTTTYFSFSLSEPTIRNATSFFVAGQSFPINSEIFTIPSLTTLQGSMLTATIAIATSGSCDNLTVQIAAPFSQAESLAPKIDVNEFGPGSLVCKAGPSDEYTFCETSWQMDHLSPGAVVVKVLVGGKVIDTLLVDREVAGW